MNQTLANIAIAAATLGTIVFLLPQILKLVRTGDSAGVSTTWAALGVVTNVGWVAYLINQQLWAALLAPLVTAMAYGVAMWALIRTGRDPRRSILLGFGWAILLVVTTVLAGWTSLGVVLAVSYLFVVGPSLWTAYRTPNPSGISAGTWWIGALEGILWWYYGAFYADAGIVLLSVIGLISAVLMLVRFYSTRHLAEATA